MSTIPRNKSLDSKLPGFAAELNRCTIDTHFYSQIRKVRRCMVLVICSPRFPAHLDLQVRPTESNSRKQRGGQRMSRIGRRQEPAARVTLLESRRTSEQS